MSEGPRLSVTPAGALEDVIAGHMRDGDFRVLAALGTFTDRVGWTHPIRQDRLAERCGFSREQVNRSLRRLEWLGWVQVKRADRTDKPSAYRVRLDPDDLRAPGAAPAVGFAAWKKACAEAARKRSGKLSAAELKTLAELPDEDADAGDVDEGGGPVESGPEGAPLCAYDHRGPVITGSQGPVIELDHTPCDHCDHSSYDSSSRFNTPLPPFPDADPVSGAIQGGAAQGADDQPGGPGGCIRGDTGPDAAQTPAAAQAETAHGSAEGRQTDGLSPDVWRSIRAELKSAVGERPYAAHVARLRLVQGRVVATSPHEAREAASAIGRALRQRGIPSIHTEAGEAISL